MEQANDQKLAIFEFFSHFLARSGNQAVNAYNGSEFARWYRRLQTRWAAGERPSLVTPILMAYTVRSVYRRFYHWKIFQLTEPDSTHFPAKLWIKFHDKEFDYWHHVWPFSAKIHIINKKNPGRSDGKTLRLPVREKILALDVTINFSPL